MQLWILLILLNIIYIDCKNALYALIWQMEFDTLLT